VSWDRDALEKLRGAVYRGDGAAVVAALHGRDLGGVLQLAGDGLLAARAQGVDRAAALARDCAERLRRRDGAGDAELADGIDGRDSDLRPLAVDLDELTTIIEGDPLQGGGRIDLRSGEIWHGSPYDHPHEDDEGLDDEGRWLWVDASSRDGWLDMEAFASTIEDTALAARVEQAIAGRGAFRRFRAILDDHPEEMTRFHVFAEERRRGRARRWLAEHGIRPTPAPSSSEPERGAFEQDLERFPGELADPYD
jgi:hypothetical protein